MKTASLASVAALSLLGIWSLDHLAVLGNRVFLVHGTGGSTGTGGTGTGGSGTGGTGTGGSATGGVAGSSAGAGGAAGSSAGAGGAAGGAAGAGGTTTIASVMAGCAAETFPTTGTIHYVCDCGTGADSDCVAGNDASAGTSKATAWRTYAKGAGQISSMSAGDTLAWCKGGSFADAADVLAASTSCSAGNPCLIRDYVPTWASGDELAPRIVVADNQNGLHLFNGGGAVHDEGYRILNLDFEGPGRDSNAGGIAMGNDVTDVTVCNVTMNGFATGANIGASSLPLTGGSDGKQARIIFTGDLFTNNGYGWLGTCNGCQVTWSHFTGTGLTSVANTHALYVDDGYVTDPSVPFEVSGETYANNLMEDNEKAGGHCNGIILVEHGQHTGTQITGNTVRENTAANVQGGCYGIAVTSGYGTPEHFTNIEIGGNTVINFGQLGIYTQDCANCTIENNLLLNAVANSYAIAWGNPVGSHDHEDADGTAATIRNNTIYIADGTDAGIGINFHGEGTGHIIANNAIYTTSTATTNAWACLNLALTHSAYTFVDNNLCYYPSASSAFWDATTGTSYSSWRSGTSFDAHSLNVAPQFVTAAMSSYDFRPNTGSPLIGAGNHTNAPTTDMAGVTRTNPPDIGALQH